MCPTALDPYYTLTPLKSLPGAPGTISDILSIAKLRLGIEGISILRESKMKASSFLSYKTDTLRFLECLEACPRSALSIQALDKELSTYAVLLYEANIR